MKRIVALILALVMTMALVACGGDKPNSTPTTPATPEKPAEDPDAWKYGGDLIIGNSNTWTSMV